MIRNFSAKITPVLCCSVAAAAWGQSLALSQFAAGVAAFERNDYTTAIAAMRQVQPELPQLADYVAYYLAAARVELKDLNPMTDELQPLRRTELASPLAARAWLVEAKSLIPARATDAFKLLSDHYRELPQPEGDLTIAAAYQASGDLRRAAETWQRVFYESVGGDAVNRASAALISVKDAMGADYPSPTAQMLLRHADRLAEIRDYKRARAEYVSLAAKLTGQERDQARVRVGVMDYFANRTAAAHAYLQGLYVAGVAEAERLYYLTELARRASDDSAMMAAIQRLNEQHPHSPWRLKALITAANRYLLINRPADFVPLYRAAYDAFPDDPSAGLYHWKVVFQAYLRNAADAADLLREHLTRYPNHSTAGAALYFLARRAEQDGQRAVASAYYRRLAQALPNHYYAMLARERLRQPELQQVPADAETARFAAALKLSEAQPVPSQATHVPALRIERSRLLRSAGLTEMADAELRFGARNDGSAAILAMELAETAYAPHQAMRIMKNLSPDYLRLPLDHAPRRYWDLLFPLPFRSDLEQQARGQGIDAFLLAGLIRQESEFNPQAVSRAKAYGLTQIRPGTGRQFARRLGMPTLVTRQLFQPSTNLKIGTTIFRSMLDQNGGALEPTLAGYNAGPSRAAEWISWNTYREPAEFVESIPFTETRDYIQAVLRNADIYRRLYQ